MQPNSFSKFIFVDPEFGISILRGPWIPVIWILTRFEFGWSDERLIAHFPGLEPEHLNACREYHRYIADKVAKDNFRHFPVLHSEVATYSH